MGDYIQKKDKYLSASILSRADHLNRPFLFAHGLKDTAVPWKHSLQLINILQRKSHDFEQPECVTHFDPIFICETHASNTHLT